MQLKVTAVYYFDIDVDSYPGDWDLEDIEEFEYRQFNENPPEEYPTRLKVEIVEDEEA